MKLKLKRLLLILSVFFSLNVVLSLSETDLLDFNHQKSNLENSFNSNRLNNYLRKIMLTNNKILDESFVFVDPNTEDFIFNESDVNFSSIPKKNLIKELKARIFSLKWAKKNYSEEKYYPVGISAEENESVPNWELSIVLYNGGENKNLHKMVKICFPSEDKSNFAIFVKIGDMCKSKIDLITKFNVLDSKAKDTSDSGQSKVTKETPSTNVPATTNIEISKLKSQLKSMQHNVERNKLKKLFIKGKNLRPEGSFIEKSSEVMSEEEEQQRSSPVFSLDTLAEKFSIEELKKIKSLIQFAKVNKIVDKIYEKNGKVKLETIIAQTPEVLKLKSIINEQKNKLKSSSSTEQSNEASLKNLLSYVQKQNSEFKQTISALTNTINSLNAKLGNVTKKISSLEDNSNSRGFRFNPKSFSFRQIRESQISTNNTNTTEFVKHLVETSVNKFLDEYSDMFISKIQTLSKNSTDLFKMIGGHIKKQESANTDANSVSKVDNGLVAPSQSNNAPTSKPMPSPPPSQTNKPTSNLKKNTKPKQKVKSRPKPKPKKKESRDDDDDDLESDPLSSFEAETSDLDDDDIIDKIKVKKKQKKPKQIGDEEDQSDNYQYIPAKTEEESSSSDEGDFEP